MGLGSIRVGGFGWTNGFGFTLPPLTGMRKEETLSTSTRKVETLRRGIWKEEILRK